MECYRGVNTGVENYWLSRWYKYCHRSVAHSLPINIPTAKGCPKFKKIFFFKLTAGMSCSGDIFKKVTDMFLNLLVVFVPTLWLVVCVCPPLIVGSQCDKAWPAPVIFPVDSDYNFKKQFYRCTAKKYRKMFAKNKKILFWNQLL